MAQLIVGLFTSDKLINNSIKRKKSYELFITLFLYVTKLKAPLNTSRIIFLSPKNPQAGSKAT